MRARDAIMGRIGVVLHRVGIGFAILSLLLAAFALLSERDIEAALVFAVIAIGCHQFARTALLMRKGEE